MKNEALLKIGTCSWKYDSWIGIIYSEKAPANYLKEYAQHYSTVEIDQWFWSLYDHNQARLPDVKTVDEYNSSVPEDFEFSIKVPNSITLTHYHNKDKKAPLIENPYFFSNELFERFLDSLSLLRDKLGPLIFQFEYLNKQKMPLQKIFLDKLHTFIQKAPKGYKYTIETRNPNYLNNTYFSFLREHDLYHVFLQGYYMPPIVEIYQKFKADLRDLTVIRLHGPNRKEIEDLTKKRWSDIVAPKDNELLEINKMLQDLMARQTEVYVNVNNHYEGSAPKTIQKMITNIKNAQLD